MTVVIKVKELSKLYYKGAAVRTLIDEVRVRWLGSATGKKEAFWGLKDVSFDIREGEVVGIIGRNGAGKSTLLKILSGITEPSHGEYEVVGRLGSLLEVGVGFHPNLTGRENVYLSGIILGASMAEIKAKFDQIVEFSGVEAFLDTPVRFYSSGMAVRLGFSVAVHLDQNIVMIDEALSVGDADFQRKCWRKLNEIASGGNTVVLVSHNMTSMSACNRVIYLEQGQVKDIGPAPAMVARYLSDVLGADNEVRTIGAQHIFGSNMDFHFNVEPIERQTESAEGLPTSYRIAISSPKPLTNLHVFARFYDDWGTQVVTAYNGEPFSLGEKAQIDFTIQGPIDLGPGRYDARFFLYAADDQQALAEVHIKRVCHIRAKPEMVAMLRGVLVPANAVISTLAP